MYSTFKAALISLISGWILLIGAADCQDGASTASVANPDGGTLAQTNASVTGSVTYRERIALSQDSTVHVQLRDTSYQDAPSVLIAEQVIHNPGQVPIEFKIDYNGDDLEPRNTYSISASITGPDGRLLFINDTAYDVITRGNPSNVDMLLVMVDAPAFDEVPVVVVGAHLVPREPGNLLKVTYLQSTIEGCSRPDSEGFEVYGSEITVTLTRMAPPPSPDGIQCDEDLVELETVIRLGDTLVPGQSYRVTVNGKATTSFYLPEPDSPFSVVATSPIERVEVLILEIFPPQYQLRIISALPKGSSCSRFNGYEVRFAGSTTIEVDVTHYEVGGSVMICTADYPVVETIIPLGSDFESGTEYTVTVNSETTETLVAQ